MQQNSDNGLCKTRTKSQITPDSAISRKRAKLRPCQVHRNHAIVATAIANFHRRQEIAAISGTLLNKETLRFNAANLHRLVGREPPQVFFPVVRRFFCRFPTEQVLYYRNLGLYYGLASTTLPLYAKPRPKVKGGCVSCESLAIAISFCEFQAKIALFLGNSLRFNPCKGKSLPLRFSMLEMPQMPLYKGLNEAHRVNFRSRVALKKAAATSLDKDKAVRAHKDNPKNRQ